MNAILEPARRRWSVDDYVRLGSAGILPEDSRTELIEGDLIDMPPIGTGHAAIAVRLTRLFVQRTRDDAIVSVGHPMALQPWSMPQPDLMLLQPSADDYASRHPDAGDALLVVEIADSSLHYDRTAKMRVYAAHGVREYWIIEVMAQRLHRFRDPVPGEGRFASMQQLEAPFSVSAQALPTVTLDSAEIWPGHGPSME